MKENEEIYDYSKYIRVPQDNEDIKKLREALEVINDDLADFTDKHEKDEDAEIKAKVDEYNKLFDMTYGISDLIDDFDPDRIEDMTTDKLDEELQELQNFKAYTQGEDGKANFNKFLAYVKTLENGEQLAEDFVKGFKALNDNQKLGMDIDTLIADNDELSDEEIRNIEQEEEEEKKKQVVQDAIGHDMYENKLEEYEEQAKNDGYAIVREDSLADIEVESEEEIENLNERLAKGSIGLTIDMEENSERKADSAIGNEFKKLSGWDKVATMGFALDGLYEEMLEDLLAFKEAFSDAQVIKGANFVNGVAPEGPEDYQEFTKSLNDCINSFGNRDKNGMTMVELGQKYNEVLQRGQKYHQEHRPRFRSHRTEERAKIYEIMGKFVDKGTVYVNTFNSLTSAMNDKIKDLNEVAKYNNSAEKELDLKTIKCSDLKNALINDIADKKSDEKIDKDYLEMVSKVRYSVRDEELIKLYEKKIFNNLKRNTVNFTGMHSDEYRERVKADAISENNNYLLLDKAVFNAYDYAEAYLVKEYIEQANKKNVSLDQMEDILKRTEYKEFSKDIHKLSSNPVFKECVKMSPAHSLEKWKKINNSVNRIKKTDDRILEELKKKNVKNPEKELTASDVASIVTMMGYGNPKYEEAMQYDFLMRSFGVDRWVIKECTQDGIADVAKYLDQPGGFMSKIKGKKFKDADEVLKMIEKEKIVEKTSSIYNRKFEETFKNHKKEMKKNDEKAPDKITADNLAAVIVDKYENKGEYSDTDIAISLVNYSKDDKKELRKELEDKAKAGVKKYIKKSPKILNLLKGVSYGTREYNYLIDSVKGDDIKKIMDDAAKEFRDEYEPIREKYNSMAAPKAAGPAGPA